MRVEVLSDHPAKLIKDAAAAEASHGAAVARVAQLRRQRAAALAAGRVFAWLRLWFAVSRAKKQVPFRSAPSVSAGKSVPTGKSEAARAGKRAEDEVAAELGELLNDDWLLFRGYRNRKGEVDHLLVGPGGVVAVEVKNHNVRVKIDGDVWDGVKIGNHGEPLGPVVMEDAGGRTPSVQVNEVADALARFLRDFGQPVDVERVVMLVHPKARVVRHSHPAVVVGTSVDAVLGCCRGRLSRARRDEIERLIRRDHRHWNGAKRARG
jgi:hypothetical protein